jgi:hypothetical protein
MKKIDLESIRYSDGLQGVGNLLHDLIDYYNEAVDTIEKLDLALTELKMQSE